MKLKITTAITLALALVLITAPAHAQRRKACRKEAKQMAVAKPALAVINNPAPSYQSGEVNVAVRGNENPIIRLQMVASGQALVEFPAKDRIFKVNPADPDLVTIEDSPTKESDRYILLRSSKQFLPPAPGQSGAPAATSMLVQMTSGMVVTLLVYPVRDLGQVVHRCVVKYDRDAIISARQAAGLAVNLDQRAEAATPKIAINSFQFAPSLKTTATTLATQPMLGAVSLLAPSTSAPATSETTQTKVKATTVATVPQVQATEVKAKNGDDKQSARWEGWGGKLKWSKSLHGLKAAAQTRSLDARERLVLVTVRNTLSEPMKIAPGHPELAVQTFDEQGRVLQVEPVKPLKIELAKPDDLLAPGATTSYLISYEAPVLGAKQRLCVSVAQLNAADEPVTVELTTGTR